MPLVRYFIVTGSVLLGFLFLADWYLPPKMTASVRNDIDRSIIRIHSSQKWPDAIQMDTRMATIAPPPLTAEAALAPTELSRQAYAYAALPPQKTSEKSTRRRAKPATRPASRPEAVQHFANYQSWDSRNW